MQPPRLAAITYGKLSSHVCPKSAASERKSFSRHASSFSPSKLPTRSGLAFPAIICAVLLLFALVRADEEWNPRLEKFRHTSPVVHIAMDWKPTIAWKASPTCAPPPICTSASFLKPRWSQDRGRREQFRNTRCVAARNEFDSTSVPRVDVRLARSDRDTAATRKQVFESAHKIVWANGAVTNYDVLQKKNYKSFKQEP